MRLEYRVNVDACEGRQEEFVPKPLVFYARHYVLKEGVTELVPPRYLPWLPLLVVRYLLMKKSLLFLDLSCMCSPHNI